MGISLLLLNSWAYGGLLGWGGGGGGKREPRGVEVQVPISNKKVFLLIEEKR